MFRFLLSLLFLSCLANALEGGPSQPDYVQFEPADMPDLVSMQTGDFAYSLPLGELPGPYGNYPLSIAYHAGISPQQEATWVGLGWLLNPGVINRDVRGVPDDQFHGGTLGFIYQYMAMQTWALDMAWSYGIFSVGSTATSSGGVGFSATIGPKIAGVAGVGFTVGTDAVGLQAGVGTKYGGLNAGVLFSTTDGTPTVFAGVSVGNGVEASAGVQYTPGQKVSHSVGFAVTGTTGNSTDAQGNKTTQFTRVGVNVSSSGVRVGVTNGTADLEGKVVATNGEGSLSVSNSKSNNGKWNTSSVGFAIVIPTNIGVFSLGFSQALHEFWSRSATSDYVYGYIYQAGPAIVADGANEIAELPYASAGSYKTNSAIPWKWAMKGRTLEALGNEELEPAYDMYSVSSEGVSGTFRPFAREEHQLYQKVSDEKTAENTIESYNTMLVDSADGWPYVNEFALKNDTVQTSEYPSYDYCVHSDSCSPYALYATLFRNEGNRLVYRKDKGFQDTVRTGMTFLFAGVSGGYFESDTLGEDRERSKKSVSSRLLRREINGYQYALYGSRKVEPVFEDDSPVGTLKGFVVTGSDGTKYYFEQPVKSYLKIDYSINKEKGSPVFVDRSGDKNKEFWNNFVTGLWRTLSYGWLGSDAQESAENLFLDPVGFWGAKGVVSAISGTVFKKGTLNEKCSVSNDKETDDYFYSYQVNMNPYATQWLLTEIRGADFVKLSDSIENNVGYNVVFHYTEPQIYRWRTPYARPGLMMQDMPNFRAPKNGYTPAGCDSRMYQASVGVKEYVYLKSIETATHRAVFILNDSAKEERVDGKGWDISAKMKTGELPIFVQASVGMRGTTDSGVLVNPIVFSKIHYMKRVRLTPEWLYVNSQLPDKILSALKRSRIVRVMGMDSLADVNDLSTDKIYGNSMLVLNIVDTANVMQKTTGNETHYGLYKIRVSASSGSFYTAHEYFKDESDAKNYSMSDSAIVFGETGNYQAAPYVNWGDLIWASDSLNLAENRMRYLKEIDFYNKADPEPYRKFTFGYDYSLQPKTLNSYCTGRYPDTTADILSSPDSAGVGVCASDTASRYLYGKLTLKSVTETGCRNGRCASLPPFLFSYNSPSESSTRVSTKDGWVSLSQGLFANIDSSSGDTSFVEQYPDVYYKNITDIDASIIATSNAEDEWGFWDYYANAENHKTTQKIADYGAAAWSLNKVTDPAGGVLTVEYERDIYGNGEDYGDETKFVNVIGYGTCGDYSNVVPDDSVSYFRDKSYDVPDSISDMLCIEVRKLYWREQCLGPQVARWDTLRPAGYSGTGFEYLDSLGIGETAGQNLFYNLIANMRTKVRCGMFGWGHCPRPRSVAVFGDGHYMGKLSADDGSRKLLILDRKWDEVHDATQRAADKIDDRSWHLENGGSRMGFLWKTSSVPQMKGGDLRVTRLTRYDIDRTAQTEYEYGIGELAQLPDSAYNTVLGNRFYASKISYALPDVDMRPKSRIVGFDDDDLFYVPGPRITYPKVTVRNTDSDGGTLNGRTEFNYITPETGVPAEFVDPVTRAELVPFMKLNARLLRWGGDVDDDEYGYRGYLVGFILYDSSMTQIGPARSVVIHEDETVPVVFYAQNIKKIRYLVIASKYRTDFDAVYDTLALDTGLTDFNEMAVSVLWDIKHKQLSLHPSWHRSQKEGFYPILYRKVEYAPEAVSLMAIVEDGKAQDTTADYERSVTYHDLTAFLGLNYRTAFYRGNGDKAIPIKVDSSIYSTVVPDVLDGVDNTGASSESVRRKVGRQVERWHYDRVLQCLNDGKGKDDVCKEQRSPLFERQGKKDSKSFTYIRYPAFQVGSVTYTGHENQAAGGTPAQWGRSSLENHRFDPLTGSPTATLAKTPAPAGEMRKLTQKTPHYMLSGDTALANEMFRRNMLSQNFLDELYSGTTPSSAPWNSIAVKDSLRSFGVSPFRFVPDSVYPRSVAPIVAWGTYKSKDDPRKMISGTDVLSALSVYQNAAVTLPDLTSFDGTHIRSVDKHFRVRETEDAWGRILSTQYSSDGLYQTGLFFPAKLSETAQIVPNGKSVAAGNCSVSGSAYNVDIHSGGIVATGTVTVTCTPAGTQRIAEYRWKHNGEWRTERDVFVASGDFKITLSSGDVLNYLRVYPDAAQAKTYVYDVYGDLVQIVAEDNTSTYYEYDPFGQLAQIRDDDGVSYKSHHREFRNDSLDVVPVKAGE